MMHLSIMVGQCYSPRTIIVIPSLISVNSSSCGPCAPIVVIVGGFSPPWKFMRVIPIYNKSCSVYVKMMYVDVVFASSECIYI
jgi:hypothetical protein